MTEKRRNLGIDVLCWFGALMLLGVSFFNLFTPEEIPVTGYMSAIPIAVRWFCMSGAMLLPACVGYILSSRRYSAAYFRIFGRLFYIAAVGGLCAILIRCLLVGEEMTMPQIIQSLFDFTAAKTGYVIGMYFGVLLAAPFINTAFHGLKTKGARLTFLLIPAALSTLHPLLQFGEITVIPEWCRGLAPIAAYIGGAYIRRYAKKKNAVLLSVLMIALLAVQTAAVLFTSMPEGVMHCPWLDSMAALPCFGIALCMVSIFRSKHESTSSAHRFFSGAAGGALLGLLVAEPLLQCLILNMIDTFPIPSTRLAAGVVIVPLVFIMCTALGLMLQIPIILIRQAGRGNEEEEEELTEAPERKPRRRKAPVVTKEEPEEEEPEETVEIAEEPEEFDEPGETEEEIEEEDESEEGASEEMEEADEAPEEDPEDEASEEDEEYEEEDEYEEDEEEYEEDEEEEEPEEEPVPELPTVSISLPRRTSQPVPQASETSSRHTITVPVSQPVTQLRLTQPPPETPIGLREVRTPVSRPAPEPEPPAERTRTYTLDEILSEQGIPVKHMPETVDDLIAELTK